MDRDYTWLFNLRRQVVGFLATLKGKRRKGFYHYSLTGDFFGERFKWGLGNSVFFLKIAYTLGLEESHRIEINEAIQYIKSFQKINGLFYDPLINLLTLPSRILKVVKNGDPQRLGNEQTKRAETRQALSSLLLFREKPNYQYQQFPNTENHVDVFLSALDWKRPWNAGSHFSHLLFFINQSALLNKDTLIQYATAWINQRQKPDGFWYEGSPSVQEKINGAMKIITGLRAINRVNFKGADKITDLCLKSKNDTHACDNFNITFVLTYCNYILSNHYRTREIEEFMSDRLAIYRQYFYQKAGGFSFNKNRAGQRYYGATITRGRNEPDIHGTVMFLWGISLITQVLKMNYELNFREFTT